MTICTIGFANIKDKRKCDALQGPQQFVLETSIKFANSMPEGVGEETVKVTFKLCSPAPIPTPSIYEQILQAKCTCRQSSVGEMICRQSDYRQSERDPVIL